ncbi:MAG TPA: hypothetical protein VKK79_09020 [Candidatus Lokiarchaeia archaeon]|nr:hypothetical protein [Candidatus Lokiarchaeia archaeon]
MPASIYPIANQESFTTLHETAGLLPQDPVDEKIDPDRAYEHFWQGIFQKS